jgi:DNA-binding HxlR family transcriptional regulator
MIDITDQPLSIPPRHHEEVPEPLRFGPLATATSILADRWTPLVVRELLLGSTRFNTVARGLPGISRSLLVQRLDRLERDGLLLRVPSPEGRGHEYHLTAVGRSLAAPLAALGQWALERSAELEGATAETVAVTRRLASLLVSDRLPDARVVIQIDHTGPSRASHWLIVERRSPSVSTRHPGFDVDAVLRAATPTLTALCNAETTWQAAVAHGELVTEGSPMTTRAVWRWFDLPPADRP